MSGSNIWRHLPQVRDWQDPQVGPRRPADVQACGSDMHFYETDKDGYILYPGLTRFPTILGHEFSGRVVEVGSEVTSVKPGDMVTVEEMIWCGHCVPCRNGFPNHCLNLEELGFTIPGAFAERIAVNEKYCWKIDAIAERYGDETKAFEVGALTEPTTVSYNAMFERAGVPPRQYVAVFGAGPSAGAIGLAARAAPSRSSPFRPRRSAANCPRRSAPTRPTTRPRSSRPRCSRVPARARALTLWSRPPACPTAPCRR